ncbi:MAG: ACT domain-containing protein [Candidatus Velthaea sp.]
MELRTLDDAFAIVRLAADAAVPEWVGGSDLIAVVRTRNELSIVCREDAVPSSHSEAQHGWRGMVVAGTLDFAVTGVIAQLTAPLAEAGISAFGISSYDTDHILVPGDKLQAAQQALRAAGHLIR